MSAVKPQPSEAEDSVAAPFPLQAARLEIEALRSRLEGELATRANLQNELELRNAALDAASSQFMIVDARARQQPIVYANRALAVQHGYANPEELIGQSVSIILSGDAYNDRRAEFQQALAEGRTVRFEMQARRRDGTPFWVGFSTTPLRNPQGEITHHVTLGADITARLEADRKERELRERLYDEMRERERMAIELRLAQKLESVGRLAAGLAHEINTPIQYVGDSVHFLRSAFEDLAKLFQGYREALAHLSSEEVERLRALEAATDFEFLSVEVPKAIGRTLEGAERVAGIVRAMKEFAHPDGAEQSPADINHALATTLTVTCNEYKYAATVETAFAELPHVMCNIGELNQVFLNIIVNAAHAIADSGKDSSTGRIAIATRVDGEDVEISIRDNGCGIPAENLEQIFDPFFTTKEVGRGTGQGLSIARSIVVDKHGGRIDVRSKPGAGSEFLIRLPIQGVAGRRS